MTVMDWVLKVVQQKLDRIQKLAEEPSIIRAIVSDLQEPMRSPSWPQNKTENWIYWTNALKTDISLGIAYFDLGEEWLDYIDHHLLNPVFAGEDE